MNMDAFESGAYWATEYKQLPKRLALVAVMLFKARGLNVASRLDAFDWSRQSAVCSDREVGVDGFTPDPIRLEIMTGVRRGEVRKKKSSHHLPWRPGKREEKSSSALRLLHTMVVQPLAPVSNYTPCFRGTSWWMCASASVLAHEGSEDWLLWRDEGVKSRALREAAMSVLIKSSSGGGISILAMDL